MLPLGTRVERINSPNSGKVGMIASDMVPTVETYLVTFDKGMPQYWSPKYFKVLEEPAPDWKV
jgi:hypothetical protein